MISYGQLTEQVCQVLTLYQSSYGLRFGIFTEWQGKYIFFGSLPFRHILFAAWYFVTQQKGPILPANHAIHLFGSITDGIKSAYNGAHTGPYHVIYRDTRFFYNFQSTYMCHSFGSSAAENNAHFFSGPRLGRCVNGDTK